MANMNSQFLTMNDETLVRFGAEITVLRNMVDAQKQEIEKYKSHIEQCKTQIQKQQVEIALLTDSIPSQANATEPAIQ